MSDGWIPGVPQQALVMAVSIPLMYLVYPIFERFFGFLIELTKLLLWLVWRVVQVAWKRSATTEGGESVERPTGRGTSPD